VNNFPPNNSPVLILWFSSPRQTIAKRLQESKQSIPHYYLTVDVNMTKVLAVRQAINSTHQGTLKLSPNDFVVKGAALAMRDVPQVNSSWMDTFIRQHHNVDINVAVSTPGGLITPIVVGADCKVRGGARGGQQNEWRWDSIEVDGQEVKWVGLEVDSKMSGDGRGGWTGH